MNRRLDVALVVADVGEILIEVGHSADVYGVTNNCKQSQSVNFSRVIASAVGHDAVAYAPQQFRCEDVPPRRGLVHGCHSVVVGGSR